jgi:hypothetical protein
MARWILIGGTYLAGAWFLFGLIRDKRRGKYAGKPEQWRLMLLLFGVVMAFSTAIFLGLEILKPF